MKGNSVLFVDDDKEILNSLKRGLIDEDYTSFFAMSAEEALAIMEENEISVIVTDMRMPGMDGLQLLKIVKEKYPKTVKIVLSGYTQLPQILAAINQVDIFKFITKPWKLEEEFKVIIRQAIEYYNLEREKEMLKEALEKRNILYQNILKSTNEKLKQNKMDLDSIREISKFVFAILKQKSGLAGNSDMLDAIQVIEDLYLEYLKTLPTSIVDCEPKKLEADLKNWLHNRKLNDWINIKVSDDSSARPRGNYILIFYIVSSLVKYLLQYVKETVLDLSINLEHSILIIIISVNKEGHNLKTDYRSVLTESEFLSFLNAVCQTIDCSMSIQDLNESFFIELKYRSNNYEKGHIDG
ncbi:response regulator [Thermoanaerobacter sp. CM-CNRG TB177]|jgi:CheY-like chemotaxis protein|uniref:response regulator n=1 Tax=Thermoanaerobacter sp. CM-CNRG TB177 TaxID=2800659 RepID=UPI001BDE29EB|nr:response regulator [Thermoanaerobacter sp. CM-CNRG TB177]MBT1280053.1 response regulator [Thermoanaerobacter sp. CM-CNRG TB177]MDK2814491.1 hypothetical protein [Thermoanaerobacter sp.]MDK2821985.1 hypothetical protein [Clostridia bacterium]